MKNGAVLFSLDGGLKGSLVQIRIELLGLGTRIEAFQPMFLQGLHQDGLRHLQAVKEVDQISGPRR